MKSCKELRAEGREILGNSLFQRRWLFPLLACMIVTGITSLSSEFFILQPIIIGALNVGLATYFLSLVRGADGEEKNFKTLFLGFKDNFRRNLGVGLYLFILTAIYLFLIIFISVISIYIWPLFFFLPIPVYGYVRVLLKYSMVYYVIVDNPEYGVWQALRESAMLTKGFRWKFFKLQLSFFGWMVLCAFTIGVGSFWLTPYMTATNVAFYEQLKQEKEYFVL